MAIMLFDKKEDYVPRHIELTAVLVEALQCNDFIKTNKKRVRELKDLN